MQDTVALDWTVEIAGWWLLDRLRTDLAEVRSNRAFVTAVDEIDTFVWEISALQPGRRAAAFRKQLGLVQPPMLQALQRDITKKEKLPYGWALDVWGNMRSGFNADDYS